MVKVRVIQSNIPVILDVHQTAYIEGVDVALFSEYQIRDHGILVDSTCKRHKRIDGLPGTQRLNLSEHLDVPMEDRGGLMGIELLPWEEGDQDRYEVFEITQDLPWNPRRYVNNITMMNESTQKAQQMETTIKVSSETSGSNKSMTGGATSLLHNLWQLLISWFVSWTWSAMCGGVFKFSMHMAKHKASNNKHFDPQDVFPSPHGTPATLKLHDANGNPIPSKATLMNAITSPIERLLNCMTNKELTGIKDYDGWKDGYDNPNFAKYPDDLNPDNPGNIIGLCSTGFDSRVFATQSWHRVIHRDIHPKKLQPYLGFAPIRRIKKTMERTTQLAKMIIRTPMRRHVKGRFTFNRPVCLNETVSTDWKFANCRSLGHGHTGMQVFFGMKSLCIDVYGGKSKSEFPNLYRDFIREQGAPSALRRDNAQEEKSQEVDAIQREIYAADEFSEPHNQQQNPVELRAIRYLNQGVHVLLDRTGAPDTAWFLASKYLAGIHNILSNDQFT